jgi:Flp pilus assembly protein TadB
MFVNPLGWVILGLCAGLLVLGNVIIRRITAIV